MNIVRIILKQNEYPKEVEKAFAPSNLQWLPVEENRKKGGKFILK